MSRLDELTKYNFEQLLTRVNDGIKMEYFYGISEGTIAENKVEMSNAGQWSPLWSIFIPKNCDKTLVEMTDEERANRHDEHTSPFTEFNQYMAGNIRIRK